jgi:phage tail sheath protein FI
MSQINETAIRTPGVYTTEIPTLPPSVAQVSTAVPAFIGYTQKATDYDGLDLTGKPTKIFSLKEYEDFFGKADNEDNIEVNLTRKTENGKVVLKSAKADFKTGTKPSLHIMYYSLRLYFENGGGPCYIVSVAATASEAIVDNTKLQTGLTAIAAFDEPTLIVFPEGQGISNGANYYSLVILALAQCASLQDRFTIIDIHKQESTTNGTIVNFRGGGPDPGFTANDNLNYGAVYYPNLKTTFDFAYQQSAIDVNIILDGGATVTTKLADLKTNADPTKIDLEAYYSALDALKKLSPTLPPSSAIAGVYARVDGSRGVWKAPANVSINSVYETTDFISDDEQGDMNMDPASGKSVNAIRAFNGKGILVWGARTLDGNSNEWRYISVRRLFIMVEESAKKATFPFVFEPNDANTWVKVRAMLENYLTLLWRQGALAGAKPEHAFFVKCGLGQTMTAQDILEGKLIVEIGMAAVRPAEFIILRFMHKLQES